jgi:hypothetical protein
MVRYQQKTFFKCKWIIAFYMKKSPLYFMGLCEIVHTVWDSSILSSFYCTNIQNIFLPNWELGNSMLKVLLRGILLTSFQPTTLQCRTIQRYNFQTMVKKSIIGIGYTRTGYWPYMCWKFQRNVFFSMCNCKSHKYFRNFCFGSWKFVRVYFR